MSTPRWLVRLGQRLKAAALAAGRFGVRTRSKIVKYPPLFQVYRVVVLIIGLALVVAGLIMCVTPGPGLATIFLGLLVLSTEFPWALRVMEWAKEKTHAAIDVVKEYAQRSSLADADGTLEPSAIVPTTSVPSDVDAGLVAENAN